MAHAFSKTCQQRTVGNAKLIGQHIEHMCLAIFIAADYPLPITPKEQHLNQMRVSELLPDQESMRKRFSKPYIYEVTTNGDGCACAFQYEPDWEGEPLIAEENERSRACLSQLSAYLAAALNSSGQLELYAGYCDELDGPPTYHGTITPEQLSLSRLNQEERKFFTISKSISDPLPRAK